MRTALGLFVAVPVNAFAIGEVACETGTTS